VQPGQGSLLAPSLDAAGRNAVIAPGLALLRGFCYETDAAVSTAIPAPTTQSRIDRLVLRMNRAATDPALFIVPTVITGTPAAKPQEPAFTQTPTGLWDLPIMSWLSASSGALTALDDERYFGTFVLSGVSTARPVMAGPGLLIETDTGNVSLWNGSAWATLYQSAGNWRTITNFAASGWNGKLSYAWIAPGLVSVAAELTLSSNANVADSTVICNIAASYAPATYKPVPLRCDALKVSGGSFESASLTFRADGSVVCYGVSTEATVLEGSGSFPTGI